MGKAAGEIVRIIITAILSVFMTIVILSGTVISNKADTEYVDKQDAEIKREFRKADSDLKEDFLREVKDIKETTDEMRKDIKELLKK